MGGNRTQVAPSSKQEGHIWEGATFTNKAATLSYERSRFLCLLYFLFFWTFFAERTRRLGEKWLFGRLQRIATHFFSHLEILVSEELVARSFNILFNSSAGKKSSIIIKMDEPELVMRHTNVQNGSLYHIARAS